MIFRAHRVLLAILLVPLSCSSGGSGSDGAGGGTADGGTGGEAGAEGTGAASPTGGHSTGGASSGGEAAAAGHGGEGNPGEGPRIGGCPVFPGDNPWNLDISGLPVHANSEAMIDSVGRDTTMHPDFGTVWNGAPIGIPFVLVDGSQADVDIFYEAYGDESDPGPFPIPLEAPIEGGPDSGGDRHVISIDTETCTLYELFHAFPESDGWHANSGVEYDLTRSEHHPEGCTSADAAGLPVFPGLVRYEEVVTAREVLHAVRFTVSASRRAYIFPARHYASNSDDENRPAMGQRFRMKSAYDCSGYSQEVRVLCTAFKRFGLIVADNGSDWYVSGAPDPRWDDDALRDLRQIPGDAFDVVDTGDEPVIDAPDCSL